MMAAPIPADASGVIVTPATGPGLVETPIGPHNTLAVAIPAGVVPTLVLTGGNMAALYGQDRKRFWQGKVTQPTLLTFQRAGEQQLQGDRAEPPGLGWVAVAGGLLAGALLVEAVRRRLTR